jgi:two-component system response regulator DesR
VTVRIMIAEDQTMVRQALVALLELESDIEVVAEAGNGDEALAMARKHEPDVVVLDIEMPGPSGIEVASQLTKTGFSGKVVIVTTFDRPGYLRAAISAGASGFLLKDAPAAGHGAIADIAGRLHLSPGTVRNHLSAAIQKLGARNRAEAVEIAQRKGWL